MQLRRFRKLFTHDTWQTHLGGSTLSRWWRCVRATHRSTILRSTFPIVALIGLYSFGVGSLLPRYLPSKLLQDQQMPLSLCGSAIGLLLVFRTNSAYARLAEARTTWGHIVPRCQSFRSADIPQTSRRARDVDIPRRRIAATPRL